MLICRDQQPVRITDAGPLLDEVTLGVEDLDALVLAVPNVNSALRVDGDAMRQVEFTNAGSKFSPGFDVISIAVKLYDTGISIAVSDVYMTVLGEGHIGWLVEEPIRL